MNWCILIPLLVGLICALLGYLLGRLLGGGNNDDKDRIATLEADLEACKSSRTKLETNLSMSRTKFTDLETNFNSLQASASATSNDTEWQGKVSRLEADLEASNNKYANLVKEYNAAQNKINELSKVETTFIPFDADAAKAVFGKKIKQDDLTLVEGIGPKIQELFHNHDVKTWKALSECSVDKCQEVLDSGGDRYKIHKPGTWPKQARLAYEGKWQELSDWQDELDGGK